MSEDWKARAEAAEQRAEEWRLSYDNLLLRHDEERKRAEAAEAALAEAELRHVRELNKSLGLTAQHLARAEAAEAALAEARRAFDDVQDDYLRRHKDACDRFEEVIELKHQLRETQKRAEAAEAALAESERDANREAAEANHQARDCGDAQRERDDWKARAEAAEARVFELEKDKSRHKQMRETAYIQQQRAEAAEAALAEMREALKRIASSNINDFNTPHPQHCCEIARAALASQQPRQARRRFRTSRGEL